MIFYRKGAGNSRAQAIFLQPERQHQPRASQRRLDVFVRNIVATVART